MSPTAIFLRLGRVNPRSSHVDIETQAVQYSEEECIDFKAIAPTCITSWVLHDFSDKMTWVDVDHSMPGVMLSQIFPWHFHQVMLLNQGKISELGGVVEGGDIKDALHRRETDAVEICR